MTKIAIFASGSGTNAQRIAEYFKNSSHITIDIILTNRRDAYVIERAKNLGIPAKVFSREDFYKTGEVFQELKRRNIDFIVLAGFLWLVPSEIINAYKGKIVNIHPALLPNYGGKGMYGSFVHKAVVANKEKFSGITIHFVNENYDEGDMIFQAKCELLPQETPESLAEKIHVLEYEHFPMIIEQVLEKQL